ncbi:MAG TPA: hypothetical protein VN859_06500 [Steroidobacteraceae bacterium]|nr:hypothetical protein [Steroidobacteraceae bacterium]
MKHEGIPGDRQASAGTLDRTEIAEQVIGEMARRQGHTIGPYFNWSLATEDFKTRFSDAFSRRAPEQSPREFARNFVDAWPPGMAAQRVVPDEHDPIANPPYSRDGLWPAFLPERK